MQLEKFTVCPFRKKLAAILLALIGPALLAAPDAVAEILPTAGTFTGYYHRDARGVGRFGHFLVAPGLHAELGKYEGKLIRLEVTKGEQPFNPGPALMHEIGTITERGPLPFTIDVRTQPSPVIAGQPFAVHITMTAHESGAANEDAAEVRPVLHNVRFVQDVLNPGPHAGEPCHDFHDYTNGQLAHDAVPGQFGACLFPPGTFASNLSVGSGFVGLVPGESWTWVMHFPAGAARGDGEVHVEGSFRTNGRAAGEPGDPEHVPIDLWQSVKVIPGTGTKSPVKPADPSLRIDQLNISPATDDGWCDLQFRLRPAEGKKVVVPAGVSPVDRHAVFPETFAAIALLDGLAADGTSIPLDVKRQPAATDFHSMRAKMMELPSDGTIIRARFRKASRFAPAMTRLVASFVTQEEAVTLTLADPYRDTDIASATPFGTVTDGVKIRVRMANSKISTESLLGLFIQAENVSGKPIVVRTPESGYGNNVVIEIDGKPIDLPSKEARYIHGWASKHNVPSPSEWWVVLPDDIKLAPGRHTLRYIISSYGGTFMNTNQEPIPVLKGRLVSNQTTFDVVPAAPRSPSAANSPGGDQ